MAVIVTGVEAVRLDGEKVTDTLAGAPAAESVTEELNPPCALNVRVAVLELPGDTVRLEALRANEKFELRVLLQLLTSKNASIDPRPVTIS